ncbi:Hypothetical protein R9X50_00024400 [Acrodontium crateriforme]|uniref:ENTH domain-containing protein n=1 Tax=Acrodontium crateriforme TaxID=150365 RepID=A0AAQ3LWX4_9PEZI|nr:Hypothetical protein R9X50_00024400 [Acrodontium crateriforme]
MSSSFEKSVRGGTKVKAAPPKSKYVEHILLATQSGEAGVAEVFRTLIHRLRESTWTVAFKALIIVHLMIKEGAADVTLSYLAVAPKNRLAINTFTDVQTQGHNIRRYSEYLLARAQAYSVARCDYVRSGDGRMKRLTVDKGLLRETEVIQEQVKALVRCDFLSNDVENEISLTAFRLLTRDLLDLYNVENEAVMNVLSRYFEMSRPDAERAVKIYKKFCKQTDEVVQFLSVARQYSHATRLEIPRIKHAPTSLANSLQEYLDDKDFDVNRRQYLAEQEGKKSGKAALKTTQAQPAGSNAPAATTMTSNQTPIVAATSSTQAKGPAPDLIDFFESIEQQQQPMAQIPQQQMPQQTGFALQQLPTGFPQQEIPQPFGFQQPMQTGANGFQSMTSSNPYGQPQMQPIQTQATGAGFGGYGPQPVQQTYTSGDAFPQDPSQMQPQMPLQVQQTSSNPFRQSMMPIGAESVASGSAFSNKIQRQSTNPFARNAPSQIAQVPEHAFAPHQTQQPQLLQAQPTGTNPFARDPSPASQPPLQANALQVQPTGSTNPFRQSMFVNQQTGQGWQNTQQATMGGLEQLETIPVFPRPGQGPTQQQQHRQSPWG